MSTQISYQTAITWKLKLELAAEGSFQAIQQLKQHILKSTQDSHPIFKESFYDILQTGYKVHEVKKLSSMSDKVYDMFIDLPLVFLLSGKAEIRCINIEGDNEVVGVFKDSGIIEIDRERLIQKFGEANINILTGFEIIAAEESIMLQIEGKNKYNALDSKQKTQKQINQSKKQHAIMNQFMILPPKQATKVKITNSNKSSIRDKLYLINGKCCFYLDDEKQIGKRIILACYHEGYINPSQYPIYSVEEIENKTQKKDKKKSGTATNIQSSFSAINRSNKTAKTPSEETQRKSKKIENCNSDLQNTAIKLYLFEESEIIYFQQQFLRDQYIKSLQIKREQHLQNIIKKYKKMSQQQIEKAQQKLINKYRLPRKIVEAVIYKTSQKNNKHEMNSEKKGTDKKIGSKNQLRSTASSVKCNIRIRKSKKIGI